VEIFGAVVVTPSADIGGFSASELLTIIGALGLLIAPLAAAIVSIIVALRTGRKADDIQKAIGGPLPEGRTVMAAFAEGAARTEKLATKVDEVHTAANSTLAAANKAREVVEDKLNVTMREVAALKEVIKDLKSERDKKV